MPILPSVVKFATLGILCVVWLALHQHTVQLDARLVSRNYYYCEPCKRNHLYRNRYCG